METTTALFNVVLVVFIVSTMLSAGFNTTFEQLGTVFKKWQPLWSCPGAPFGTKLVMTAQANVQTGAHLTTHPTNTRK